MLTNCLSECAHLTITVSQLERDIGRTFSHSPLCIRRPRLGGSQLPVGIRFDVIHERDGHTDTG